MTENAEEQTTEEAWREVGRQFQALGESLAETFRAAWESEETRRHVQNMQGGLEAMVEKVDQALKEAIASPEGEKLRTEAEKAAESIQTAGEQTWHEVQPHLLSALNQINAELQRIIGRMKGKEATSEAPAAEVASDEPDGE